MDNKQFDFLDILTIIAFMVGLESLEIAQKNLVENRQQTEYTQKILNELNYHLKQQDEILEKQNSLNYTSDYQKINTFIVI